MWHFLALHLFFENIVSILDDKIAKRSNNIIIPIVLLGSFSSLIGILYFMGLGLLGKFPEISPQAISFALLFMLVYFSHIIFWFKSFLLEEVSLVIALFYTHPIYTAILGWLFLGERLSLKTYLGIIIVVSGVFLLNIKHQKKWRDPYIWYIIIAAVINAFTNLVTKIIDIQGHDIELVFWLSRVWFFLPVLLIGYLYRKIIKKFLNDLLKEKDYNTVKLVSLNECAELMSMLFYSLAIASGVMSIVAGLSCIIPLLVLITDLVIRKITELKFKGKPVCITLELRKKLLPILLIVVGATLIV